MILAFLRLLVRHKLQHFVITSKLRNTGVYESKIVSSIYYEFLILVSEPLYLDGQIHCKSPAPRFPSLCYFHLVHCSKVPIFLHPVSSCCMTCYRLIAKLDGGTQKFWGTKFQNHSPVYACVHLTWHFHFFNRNFRFCTQVT